MSLIGDLFKLAGATEDEVEDYGSTDDEQESGDED
jgi:hypothetical protein